MYPTQQILNDVTIVYALDDYVNGDEDTYGPIENWKTGDVTDGTALLKEVCELVPFDEDISDWDMSSVTTMEAMFEYCHVFDSDISQWDVSKVTSLASTFDEDFVFDADLSGWDVSKNQLLRKTFQYCEDFDRDLSSWDTKKVTDMSFTFEAAFSFNTDLSDWTISKVATFYAMFRGAKNFGQKLSWNPRNGADTNSMFTDTKNGGFDD